MLFRSRDTAAHYRLPSLPLPLLLPSLPIHLFRDTMALRFHHCCCHQSLVLATCQRFHLPFITVLQRFVSTIISLISHMYFKNQMYYVSTIKHTIQKKRPMLHAQNECTTPAVLHHMLYSVDENFNQCQAQNAPGVCSLFDGVGPHSVVLASSSFDPFTCLCVV